MRCTTVEDGKGGENFFCLQLLKRWQLHRAGEVIEVAAKQFSVDSCKIKMYNIFYRHKINITVTAKTDRIKESYRWEYAKCYTVTLGIYVNL